MHQDASTSSQQVCVYARTNQSLKMALMNPLVQKYTFRLLTETLVEERWKLHTLTVFT